MEGVIEGYAFSFFTAEHPTTDVRGTRKVTAIEVILNSHLPFEGGVASHGMIPVLKSMGFIAEIQPTHEGWNTACLATTTHRYAMEAYLTPERVQALMTLLKIPRAWITLIFKGETALLRIDTPSPLEQLAQLEKLKKILLKTAAILELKEGEIGRLKAEMTRATPKAEAPAPLSASTSALTLELEEDEEKEESETSED